MWNCHPSSWVKPKCFSTIQVIVVAEWRPFSDIGGRGYVLCERNTLQIENKAPTVIWAILMLVFFLYESKKGKKRKGSRWVEG
ncbi:unnamed protein product [Lactuca virosa]|uniref:Uncharacterized protein n=1 Tax=Lactuca virosa TaxID=75947 RepID=A0AAU9MVF4_9ASTR|nr:unnamed protein product [Lactuca virosa]